MKKLFGNSFIIAVGIGAFVLARPVGTEIYEYFAAQPVITEAKAVAMIEDSPVSEMYAALRRYFPEEAEYFMSSFMVALKDNLGNEDAFSKMFAVGAEIRQRHAANLRTAPDQLLRSILEYQTQVIAAFEEDPMLCNRVVMLGAAAIPKSERKRIVGQMESAGLLYRAMYEGTQSPVQRAQATDEDWGNLFVDFYETGGTDEELELVTQPDVENPELCGAMLRFLDVLTEANFSGSDRLRAETVAAMNEG
ncbi:hypothetical protein ACEWPM_007355 [Roseovarius sp. S4756]|uniref:hypothetical protein n=1 Tax=Roseovarius maritimus TaxID=3342637 RepID=UPI0037280FAF